jgi:hypothetical protein
VSAIPDNADAELEERILTASVKCALARTQEEHTPLWREFVALIARRSPAQIRRMEEARGLR